VPCFGLTGPFAGSDATSIPDYGIVCKGEWNGANVLGIKLTFDKRYITLAPVATLIGLAFRMYDPDGLLGDKRDIGITLALVPRDTAGVESAAATSRSTRRSRTARSAARTCSSR
jgi:acyl-CoA dehydrogenase